MLAPAALAAPFVVAQGPADHYDPRIAFAPLTLPQPVNAYHSGSGAPGPTYWQNEADYVMHAVLDAEDKVLRNDEVITYTNNSPEALDSLWLHMEQNIYRKDSRAHRMAGQSARRRQSTRNPAAQYTNGFELDSVTIERGAKTEKANYLISDTRMQIRLDQPLAPKGGVLRIHIRYHHTIPGKWGGRTSWGMTKDGPIFDIAQWYPRMCVFDDLRGWDTLPYLGNEFYLEYGHFDYYVTVPWEAWECKSELVWTGEEPIASATIDPDHLLPDDDRADNMASAKK